jgi:hypothetical protein
MPGFGVRHSGQAAGVVASQAASTADCFDGLDHSGSLAAGRQGAIKAVTAKVFVGIAPADQTCPPDRESALGRLLAERGATLVEALSEVNEGAAPNPAIVDWMSMLDLEPVEQLVLGLALQRVLDRVNVEGPIADTDGTFAVDRSRVLEVLNVDDGMSAAERPNAPHSSRAALLIEALSLCADTPVFERLAASSIQNLDSTGSGTGESDLGHFRRCLQAGAAIRKGGSDEFAVRVRETSLDALGRYPGMVSDEEKASRPGVARDHFYWDSGFRSESVDSDLGRARKTFEMFVQGFAPKPHGLLQPVARHGLISVRHPTREAIIEHLGAALKRPEAAVRAPAHAGELVRLAEALRPEVEARVEKRLATLVRIWPQVDVKSVREGLILPLVDDLCMALQVERMAAAAGEGSDLDRGLEALRGIEPLEFGEAIRARLQGAELMAPEIFEITAQALERQRPVSVFEVLDLASRRTEGRNRQQIDQALEACETLRRELNGSADLVPPPGPESVVDAICDALSNMSSGHSLTVATGKSYTGALGGAVNFRKIADTKHFSESISSLVVSSSFEREQSKTRQFRVGAHTHGGEVFLGNEKTARTAARIGVPVGPRAGDGVVGGVTAMVAGAFDRRSAEAVGLVFRVRREMKFDGQDFSRNDETVHAMLTVLAREIMKPHAEASESQAGTPLRLDDVIDRLINEPSFDLDLLSLEFSSRPSSSTSGSFGVGAGLGASLKVRHSDRLGVTATGALVRNWVRSSESRVEAGQARYTVNAARESSLGKGVELRGTANLTALVAERRALIPVTGVVSGGLEWSDNAIHVKARAPKRHGEIFADTTFLEFATGDLDTFKSLVHGEGAQWAQARDVNGSELNPDRFFDWANQGRHDDNVYNLRKRMHHDVARRVDALASLQRVLPDDSTKKGELDAEIGRIVSDSRAWVPVGFFANHKQARTDERGLQVFPSVSSWLRLPMFMLTNLFRAKEVSSVESLREIDGSRVGQRGLYNLERLPEVKEKVGRLLRGDPEDGLLEVVVTREARSAEV